MKRDTDYGDIIACDVIFDRDDIVKMSETWEGHGSDELVGNDLINI